MKRYNPRTPSQRGLVLIDRSGLSKKRPNKQLTERLTSNAGRNNLGRITVRGRSFLNKRLFRIIDKKRAFSDSAAGVRSIEYDPNRSAFIMLVENENRLSYLLAPAKVKIGDKLFSSNSADIVPGNCMQLKHIPVGTVIHNVEIKPGAGFKLFRAAGVYAQIVAKEHGNILIKAPSGKLMSLSSECKAVIGSVSNSEHNNQVYAKAGRRRYMGFSPKVRGVAMNPVDHCMGGGEGRTSGGRDPASRNGLLAKGYKTKSKKKRK